MHMPRGEGESDGGNRLIRLLRLMRMIEARPGLGSAELAAELQVSERTVFRDVDAMRVAGVPVKARRQLGGYVIEGEVLSSARGLEADELAAVAADLEAAKSGAADGAWALATWAPAGFADAVGGF